MTSIGNIVRSESPANEPLPTTTSKNQPGLSTMKKRRKLGRPEELVAADICDKSVSIEESKPRKVVRKKLSFLPKIDLEDVPITAAKALQQKRNRLSLQKKLAVFKVKRHAIEGKNLQNLKRRKRKTVLTKGKSKLASCNENRNYIIEILDISEDSNENSEMKTNGSPSKNKFDLSKIVFKELYVDLVPLEKTNLLSKKQMLELNIKNYRTVPLCDANFNNYDSKSIREAYSGKENVCKTEIQKIQFKHLRQSAVTVKNSNVNIVPCKVIIERMTAEQLKMLTLSKDLSEKGAKSEEKIADSVIDSNENDLTLKHSNKTIQMMNVSNKDVDRNQCNAVVCREKINKYPSLKKRSSAADLKSVENNDESIFSPVISSSPLITRETSGFSQLTSLTYNPEADEEHVETGNWTIGTGIENDEMSKIHGRNNQQIRRNFAELPQHVFDSDNSLGDTVNHSTRKSDKRDAFTKSSSTKNKGNTPNKLTRKSGKYDTFTKSPSVGNLTYEVERNMNTTQNYDRNLTFDKDVTFVKNTSITNRSSNLPDIPISSPVIKLINHRNKSLSGDIAQVQGRRSILSHKKRYSCSQDVDENDSPANMKRRKLTPERRRSTFTLEESVNDITLLKSGCDTSAALLKEIETTELESLENTMDNEEHSKQSQPDFSNVTFRKTRHLHSNDLSVELTRLLTDIYSTSSLDLEGTSPPWDKTDLVIDKTSSKANTPKSVSAKSDEHDENINEDIEQSDKKSKFTSSTIVGSSSVKKVRFGIVPRASCLKMSTPKSLYKKEKSSTPANSDRRVTFSDTSVIIIDDDSSPIGSPDRKITVHPVPTNFPCDEEDVESNDDSVILVSANSTITIETSNKHIRNTIGCTPKHLERNEKNSGSSSSPQFKKKSLINAGRTTKPRISSPNSLKLPNTNGKTPDKHVSLRSRFNSNNSSSSNLNKRIDSTERSKLEGSLFMSPNNRKSRSMDKTSSKKTKMPDFAKIHKKLFDKMLDIDEYSKRKRDRAELLLSGKKPEKSSLKKHNKQQKNDSFQKMNSKKKLQYSTEPSSSSILAVKPTVLKKSQIVCSTPKGVKNEQAGYTRYGFRVVPSEVFSKKEQIKAVANKTRPPKLKTTEENRNDIKGVRSNRRFDLLMQMRQKK